MGILTANEIKREQGNGIIIEPFQEQNVNPNSYNLRLDLYSLKFAPTCVKFDCAEDNANLFEPLFGKDDLRIEKDVWLLPSRLYLACTIEHTTVNNYIPIIVGRSSLARLGVEVHRTAGFGDLGFNGFWTLEITCTNKIRVYHGMNIAQIYFVEPKGEIDTLYTGKYQNNEGCQTSKLYLDNFNNQ